MGIRLGGSDYSYYVTRVVRDADGLYVVGDEISILEEFPLLRIVSVSGVSALGGVKGVYAESWSESDGIDVYISSDVVRESTELSMDIVFIDVAGSGYGSLFSLYRSFLDYLSGCLLLYRDDVRCVRLLLYLGSSSEPSEDVVDGVCMLRVTLSFVNVFGRGFGLDEMVIADYLGIEEYPVLG